MIFAKLKAWKEESKLTYGVIAERADIPTATVQKIISGETQNPSAETIYKICKALGHTMEELYDGAKAENKEEQIAVAVIREMYENRIADIKEQHLMHIAEIKDRIGAYKKAVAVLSIATAVLFILFFAYFMVDYSTEHWGIFFNVRR